MNTEEKEEAATLQILCAIEQKSDVSQRHIADQLGVALGLANSYLRRCVRKGLIKVKQAPANRYLYYLTPKGFAEKSRLTAQYLLVSFELYRKAGASFVDLFELCGRRNQHRLLLAGVSELAEIASLRAHDYPVQIIGTYDPNGSLYRFLGLPVWHDLRRAEDFDACVLTDIMQPATCYAGLVAALGESRVLVPAVLAGAVVWRQR
ncbi:MAG: winged helix-turn-helix transcriptional regulator [Gammaproteobacteria bacterium]